MGAESVALGERRVWRLGLLENDDDGLVALAASEQEPVPRGFVGAIDFARQPMSVTGVSKFAPMDSPQVHPRV